MKHLSEEYIAQYAEALARGEQDYLPEEMRKHVKECNHCADEVMAVYELMDTAASDVRQGKKNKFSMKPAYWVSIAAGITILIGVGGYMIFYGDKQVEMPAVAEKEENIRQSDDLADERDTLDQDTTRAMLIAADTQKRKPLEVADDKANKPLLAQAFEPHEGLEKLAARFEGESMRSSGFKVVSPHQIIVDGEESINFEWSAEQHQQYIFTLLDNSNSIVFEKTVSHNGHTLEEPLNSGLYYWKLMNEDFDLLYCGKIKVK
jgi:hypothetical protein